MPNQNGQGPPNGNGPKTGRKLGNCQPIKTQKTITKNPLKKTRDRRNFNKS